MDLVAYDPYANPSLAASANVELVPSMDELFSQADFLTIHTPMIASTKGMIGISELKKMKPTACVLNVARGGIVEESALLSALESGVIAGAGIDVFTTEPPQAGDSAHKLMYVCDRVASQFTCTNGALQRTPKGRCYATSGSIHCRGTRKRLD